MHLCRRLPTHAVRVITVVTLGMGCRAFDPEPAIVNLPPDTFIVGAPSETTGTLFRRRLYWYGSDADGEVLRFQWALTDGSVQDDETPTTDEEDARFDPCDDATTMADAPGRRVGWTTATDSTFIFSIADGAATSAAVTFHLVAIDDRGGCDATPARLHFFSNALGNPQLVFRVWTHETPQPRLRWEGSAFGPLPGSPEHTPHPFVGFGRKFTVSWQASSPNGAILGYQYRLSAAVDAPVLPRDPQSQLATFGGDTSFVFANAVPLEQLPVGGCAGGDDCPELRRLTSGQQLVRVTARDIAQVENLPAAGGLVVEVNYPPQTWLVLDEVACSSQPDTEPPLPIYPQYRVRDDAGQLTICTFAPGDTVPAGSYVVVRMRGRDPSTASGLSPDSLCCDTTQRDTSVTFQGRVDYIARPTSGGRENYHDGFNPASSADTLGFLVGPFEYTFSGRANDEHGRPDPEAATLRFVGGFPPRMTGVAPGDGDTLILRRPDRPAWDDNEVPYTVIPNQIRYWDAARQRWALDGTDPEAQVGGALYRYELRFESANDPREPIPPPATDGNRFAGGVRAWAYELSTQRDPENQLKDGGGIDNLAFYNASPAINQLVYSDDQAVEVFVPAAIWIPEATAAYEPGGPAPGPVDQGLYLRRHLGQVTLRVIGRTTARDARFPHWPLSVRPGAGDPGTLGSMPSLGRRTQLVEHRFTVLLGIEDFQGRRLELWPPPRLDFEIP